MCHHKFVETQRMYSTTYEPSVYRLWAILTYNTGSSFVTNVPLYWGMLIMGETMHVWTKKVYGKSAPFAQFFWEPKTALKNKVYFLKMLQIQKK